MNRSNVFYYFIIFGWTLSTLGWWGFAFLPNEQTSPDWVLASRDACFGTLSSGLPDIGGWILLIGTPLTFLIAILTIWPVEIKKAAKSLLSSNFGRTTSLTFLSLVIIEGVLVTEKIKAGLNIENIDFSSSLEGDLPEHYPRTFTAAPLFKHLNHEGKEVALSELLSRHETVVLSFAFAQCQTVCPMILKKLKKAATEVNSSSAAFVVITLDPWRDTRTAIASWAAKEELPENAHILTGPVQEIQRTLRAYRVPSARNDKTGNVDHPPLTYIVDSNSKIAYTLGNVPPRWITQAVKKLVK